MKYVYLAGWLLLTSFSLSAQNTIFLFDWEVSTDPKVATIGPNASSISAEAVVQLRQDGTSNGLAAGAPGRPKLDIVMVLDNDPIFNKDGIDLSIDYLADESALTVFSRNNFKMINNASNVAYRVTNSNGSCSAVITSTSVATARDNTYHTYRFRYDPVTGEATYSVDGNNQWTNAGNETPGQPLCWTNDGDITIGVLMDGSGNARTLLDNIRMDEVAAEEGLPVELTYFHAEAAGDRVDFRWQTASEIDNDYFAIERSGTDTPWEEITRVAGLGTSNEIYVYEAADHDPLPGKNYYRLKQVDFDGRSGYSGIRAVATAIETQQWTAYPNPTADFVYLGGGAFEGATITLYDQRGRLLPVQAQPTAGGVPPRSTEPHCGELLRQLWW